MGRISLLMGGRWCFRERGRGQRVVELKYKFMVVG